MGARDGMTHMTAARVAARWMTGHEAPPAASRPAHLPVALVATLQVGDLVLDMGGVVRRVSSVGPGSLTLDTPTEQLIFTNRGYRSWSWAYDAAPRLHWLINR